MDTIRDIETLQFSDGAIATSEFIDRKPLEIAGTTADDIQLGTAGNDVFLSSGGNDRIWGGTGGDDLMKLSGNFADYVLRNNGDGSFTITDTRSGLSDGTDVVRGIGSFQFADRSATLAEFEAAQSFNIVRDGQGTAGSDILLGSYGDDILYGNGGMDRIWGGMGGEDTVVFDGAFADYVITDNVNGAFTVKEIRDGATTTAVVRDVEHFQFSDGIVEAADVANGTESLANILRGTAADEYVHGAHTDGLFDAHTNDYIIGNAGADLIRGGAGDDYILGDSLTDTTEHVYTVIPDTELPRFEFEPGLFQAINGQLAKFEPATGEYTPIGPDHPNYNAAGLNPLDGYMYAVGTGGDIRGHLLRIGSDGNYESLGSGFPAVPAGGVAEDGKLYLLTGRMEMTVIDLQTLDTSTIAFSGTTPGAVHDIVFVSGDNGSGTFYGITPNAVLVAYDMTTMTVSETSIDGLITGQGAYGAGWSAADGGLYFSHNSTGNIYGISGIEGSDPQASLLMVGGTSSTNDGASFGGTQLPAGMAEEGGDILLGGTGNDTLDGGMGGDFLDGGPGSDILIGGFGADAADYSRADASVHADLSIGGITGEAAGDIYESIENLIGSRFDDTLVGDAGDNEIAGRDGDDTISGGAGNDVLRGQGGADILDGGDGNDIATYFGSAEGVTVDLEAGSGSGGEAEGDTLISIETVQGSNLAGDYLHGSSQSDLLQGFGGDDQLDGRDGDDILHGGGGNDSLLGGDGDDLLLGQDGNDQLSGGNGADNLQGGDGNDILAGGAGNDALWGAAGNDTLNGGAGDDRLRGGDGADTFVFSDLGGGDTVLDFEFGIDTLDFSNVSSIASMADLDIEAAGGNRFTISYSADGVAVSHSILATHGGQFTEADFLFQ